jgi:hypothetical protein
MYDAGTRSTIGPGAGVLCIRTDDVAAELLELLEFELLELLELLNCWLVPRLPPRTEGQSK